MDEDEDCRRGGQGAGGRTLHRTLQTMMMTTTTTPTTTTTTTTMSFHICRFGRDDGSFGFSPALVLALALPLPLPLPLSVSVSVCRGPGYPASEGLADRLTLCGNGIKSLLVCDAVCPKLLPIFMRSLPLFRVLFFPFFSPLPVPENHLQTHHPPPIRQADPTAPPCQSFISFHLHFRVSFSFFLSDVYRFLCSVGMIASPPAARPPLRGGSYIPIQGYFPICVKGGDSE